MDLYIDSSSVAVVSQENRSALRSPYCICWRYRAGSFSKESILWAISSALVGSHSKAPGPPTSGMEEVLEVMTGVPQAIASSKGMPKLSRNDVYRKAKAPLYR